jgi:archaetidylinositol phosphate synthase
MSATSTYRPAVRLNTSVLAAAEKRLLVRIARRLPSWVNSDHLTAIGIAATLGIGACFWLGRASTPSLVLVLPLLALNWFGDSLDGTLARVRQQERPRYGYYVDHVLDTVGVAALIAGLVLGKFMTPWIGFAFLSAYYALVIEIALAAHARRTFRMAFWYLGPTELRILLAAGVLQLIHSPEIVLLGHRLLLFDVGASIGTGVLVLTFIVSASHNGSALYREETRPHAPSD